MANDAQPAPDQEQPTQERVEALLQLIADEEDRTVLERILQALAIGHKPTDGDVELYNDLWEVFGEDVEDPADKDEN